MANTTYDEVRDFFLNKITSFELGKLFEDEANEVIDKYLKIAISRFYNCTKDLNNRDDVIRTFNITLSLQEQNILASLMGLEWLSPKVMSEEVLRNHLGSRDYTTYSPANLLKEMTNLKREVESDVNDLMTLYHYTN
jgi:hypothetical protein